MIKTTLQIKLEKSEEKRNKIKKQKVDAMKKQRQYKSQIFQERLQVMKQQQKQDRLEKLRKYNLKFAEDPQVLTKKQIIPFEDEQHYRKMKRMEEMEYEERKKNAEKRKIFSKVDYKPQQRRFSTGNLLGCPKYQEVEKDKINKMGEHLVKIQTTRQKKQNMLSQRTKKSQSLQNYAAEQQKARLRQLQEQQEAKRAALLKKLVMESPKKGLSLTGMPRSGYSSLLFPEQKPGLQHSQKAFIQLK